MIIAVDFDGTIVEHSYPSIGKEMPFATETLKMLANDGHRLILWTVRKGELLEEAISRYRRPSPKDTRVAVEKLWGAFERLKTYYKDLGKAESASKIVNDIAGGEEQLAKWFDNEFKELSKIGNGCRIRHHERDQLEVTDPRLYDYFFNRCLLLIALAIQYLD